MNAEQPAPAPDSGDEGDGDPGWGDDLQAEFEPRDPDSGDEGDGYYSPYDDERRRYPGECDDCYRTDGTHNPDIEH